MSTSDQALHSFPEFVDNTAKAVNSIQHRQKPQRIAITPGMLVSAWRHNVIEPLWSHYTIHALPSGLVRVTMHGLLDACVDETALVIAVPRPVIEVKNIVRDGVVMLYLPTSQRFACVWSSSLRIVAGDPNA